MVPLLNWEGKEDPWPPPPSATNTPWKWLPRSLEVARLSPRKRLALEEEEEGGLLHSLREGRKRNPLPQRHPCVALSPPCSPPSRKLAFSQREAARTGSRGSGGSEDRALPAVWEIGEELLWTGRFCGGLCLDVKRKAPWFPSDFYDGFHLQSVSATFFIYLGCITNAITFGGLLGDATENYQGVLESFLGTAVAGSVFCLCAGQPLIILSSTGPILVFEKLLYDFSRGNNMDYLEFRLWIGLHSALQCFILVATDASFIIKYVTRFTEEGFSTLISFIFIYDAIKKMIGVFKSYPINAGYKPDDVTMYKCECLAPDAANATLFDVSVASAPNLTDMAVSNSINLSVLDWTQLSRWECLKYGGRLEGESCEFVPDVALMCFILFFGTSSMALALKKFRSSRYFPTKVRSLMADFSLVFSILCFCGLDLCLGLETPKVHVPRVIQPTRPDRGWFVAPFGKNPWWIYLASALPALLVTILIFMDQQITAVIVNRKEHKLRKAAGYHLDLFWVGLLLGVCSFTGLPWYVAATVISLAHLDSLKMETESKAPGEQPQFLGVREQRVTGILVFLLTGISVFLAPVLKYIPMPVLYGVFLYMGVASLSSIQFWERCKLFLMPAKHQPDYIYLRHVPLRRVHLFTTIQTICLAVLWALKSTLAAIIFPVMIIALIFVRKMLDFVFSQHDLAWIDNVIPGKEEETKERKRSQEEGPGKETSLPVGVWPSESFPGPSDLDHSIILHLKISCPSSPACRFSQANCCLVPQVKLAMEPPCEDSDPEEIGRETAL